MKTLLFSILTFLITLTGFAQTFTDNGLNYNVISTSPNEVEITGGTPASTDLVIPEIVNDGTDNYTVTSVGDQAFTEIGLTSVTFPATITAIGEQAFQKNQFVNLVLPQDLLSLGLQAFQGNRLEDIIFPDSLPVIGEAAFSGNQLTSLNIPASVTSIEAVAFRNNPLTSLTLSEGLLTIGDEAFRINQLTSLTLPSTVTTIGARAFETNNLTSVKALAIIPTSIITGTDDSFGNNRNNITLFVPSSSVEDYTDAAWTGFASINTVIAPYIEDFETFTTSGSAFISENGWTSTGGDYFWEAAPSTDTSSDDTGPDPSITTGNYFFTEASSGNAGDTTDLVSPLINLTNLTAPALSFNYHMFGIEIGTLDILVNGTDIIFTLSGEQQTSANQNFEIAEIDLSAYTGQTISVTFRGTRGSGLEGDIAIDNIAFDELSACSSPIMLNASNVTDVQADLSWTENGTATLWDIELVDITAGETTTGNPTDSGITNTSFTASGLIQDNSYAFFVRADCGADGTSAWVGPFNFTTPCSAFTTSYAEDFETFTTSDNAFTGENCWTATGGDYFWEAAPSTDTSSGNTGPDPSITTGNYFFTEASSGSAGDTTDLVSPLIDLTNLTAPALSFNYHMFGSEMGTLDILVNGTDTIFTLSGEQQTSANQIFRIAEIDLSAYTGQTISVTFRGTSAGTFEGDIAIDNIAFDELSTCSQPIMLNVSNITDVQADLSWTENGTATLWDIELLDITAGEIATGNPTNTGLTNTTFTATGLTTSNNYAFLVRADCGADGVSNWTGPFTFATAPVNDNCIDAIALTISVASMCPANVVTNTIGATEVADEITSCDTGTNLGVWYSFTAPASGQMKFTSGAGDPGIAIYEGTCDALTEVAGTCFNNTDGSIFGLTPGNSYFAMIWTDNPETNVEFCLFSLPCAAAAATTTTVNCGAGEFSIDVDVTDLGSSTTVTISNDAGVPSTDLTTTGVVNVGPFPEGTDVTITLTHDSDTACDLVLPTSSSLCPPPNDDCGTAEAITQEINIDDVANATANPGTITGATDSGLASETCNSFTGIANDDVWYAFEALTSDVTITFDTDFDAVVQLFSGTCGALTVIDCADGNFSSDGGIEEISATGLTVGETYYTRIYSFGGTNITGVFDLKIWSSSTLSTNALETENAFTYYPNPVKNTLTLNAKQNINTLVIYNMLGQEVLKTTPNTLNPKVDMSSLQNGAYFVKVSIENTTKTIRVVKQ